LVLDQDFNTYQNRRAWDGADPFDFYLYNQNGAADWTWAEILTLIQTALGTGSIILDTESAFAWPVTYNPRNIIGKGVSAGKVLAQLLRQVHAFLVVDFTCAGTGRYTICQVKAGLSSVPPYTELETLARQYATEGGRVYLNPKVVKADELKVAFSQADHWDAANYDRVKIVDGKLGIGGTGKEILFDLPYAASGLTGWDNLTLLEDIATDQGTRYEASFANAEWWLDYTFVGIHIQPLIKLSAIIHEITWQSTEQGVFTRVKAFRPRSSEDKLPDDALFSYENYWLPFIPNGDVDCQTLVWDGTHNRWYAGPARLM
jgi:hypothetical protein